MRQSIEKVIRFDYDAEGRVVSESLPDLSPPTEDDHWSAIQQVIDLGGHDYMESVVKLIQQSEQHALLVFLAVQGLRTAHEVLLARTDMVRLFGKAHVNELACAVRDASLEKRAYGADSKEGD